MDRNALPADFVEAFKVVSACGEIVIAASNGEPTIDRKIVETFDDFSRRPELRAGIESELESSAQACVELRIRDALFHNEPAALGAEIAGSDGDADAVASFAGSVAEKLD
jgi:hypothetical protein